jgi:predicted SAM-dependent methyltransferase
MDFGFSNTKLSPKRSIKSYAKVQALITAVIRNRAFLFKSIEDKEYLDLGCGPNTHSEFINFDYSWHPGVDICWDVTRGLPLLSQSVKGIFTEHCLEHLTLETTDYVLKECWRVLRPGGTIRIVVPDGELYLTNYTRIISGAVGIKLPYAECVSYKDLYSPIMSVNEVFRSHGHLFIHDFDTLRLLLVRNGFINVKKESFQSGRDHKLIIDSESRAIESLYVEGSKPNCTEIS